MRTHAVSNRQAIVLKSLVVWLACATVASGQHLPVVDPEEVGFDGEALAQVDDVIQEGLADGQMSGCVLCVGRLGKVAYLKAYGNRLIDQEQSELMTNDTLFDLASITKPVATATSILKLVEDGAIGLQKPVAEYFPEFGNNGKETISVEQLLLHTSGLIPDNPLRDYLDGPELAWRRICELKPVVPVGSAFKYSDVNYIVLGKLVERCGGSTLDMFFRNNFLIPLEMHDSGFNPDDSLKARAAATEKRGGEWMRGEVHDPRAYEMGGVAGHAGLFSTAMDLAIYAQMMIDEGARSRGTDRPTTERVLEPNTIALMTKAYQVPGALRGLGWDKQSGYSSNKGTKLSAAAFGHGGFTGTVLWIDPEQKLFFIFLSSRLHPDGKGSVNRLAGRLLDQIVDTIR